MLRMHLRLGQAVTPEAVETIRVSYGEEWATVEVKPGSPRTASVDDLFATLKDMDLLTPFTKRLFEVPCQQRRTAMVQVDLSDDLIELKLDSQKIKPLDFLAFYRQVWAVALEAGAPQIEPTDMLSIVQVILGGYVKEASIEQYRVEILDEGEANPQEGPLLILHPPASMEGADPITGRLTTIIDRFRLGMHRRTPVAA